MKVRKQDSKASTLTHVTVFTAYMGTPDVVLNAGSSILPKSSARASKMGSPERENADRAPPRYRMTVSKNGAKESLDSYQRSDHMWSVR